MNTGSNRVKKALASIAAAAISSLVSTTVLAGPDQLDILGLVPGVSELTQVQQVRQADAAPQPGFLRSRGVVYLEIGGHKMPCNPTFINGKLASLPCLTGTGKDDNQHTKATNTEVHSTLTAGFTKKFGEPDSVNTKPVRTRNGVEYEQQLVTWLDNRGNKLVLLSILGLVTQGFITLESSEYLEQEAEKNAENAARKKF